MCECKYYSNCSSTKLTSVNKKDKRRHQIGARLSKLETTFGEDNGGFYRTVLHNLLTSLAAIQQGSDAEFLAKSSKLEQERDYELTRLRLWEEYQVKRVETEYKVDIVQAKETYDMMVKLLKEKFYDKLQRQVKQLKEDKLLLNLINASLWNTTKNDATVSALSAAAAALSLSVKDRRSLRKRDFHSRFASGETDDLSESNLSGGFYLRGSGSGTNGTGYVSASSGKRRRHYSTRYSSNDEGSSAAGVKENVKLAGTASSGNDSNLSDKDYDALNHMIMNSEEGVPLIFGSRGGTQANTRSSHKQFVGVQGLRAEELNSDLDLLRNAVKRER